jgi:hypothetical protein
LHFFKNQGSACTEFEMPFLGQVIAAVRVKRCKKLVGSNAVAREMIQKIAGQKIRLGGHDWVNCNTGIQ